ncbi:hypothetical protein EX30DRAFT_340853 [Ascodesmis nigricans]|uniref:Uncharacterized protein n=1 Tax=Ascodesmis nigricans TaxID=341454 RepID=A0A4S2MX47_9PEZI|nr:hypothetical protein EX30DRAFT_340853 [Ascodesmis nigricans]
MDCGGDADSRCGWGWDTENSMMMEVGIYAGVRDGRRYGTVSPGREQLFDVIWGVNTSLFVEFDSDLDLRRRIDVKHNSNARGRILLSKGCINGTAYPRPEETSGTLYSLSPLLWCYTVYSCGQRRAVWRYSCYGGLRLITPGEEGEGSS